MSTWKTDPDKDRDVVLCAGSSQRYNVLSSIRLVKIELLSSACDMAGFAPFLNASERFGENVSSLEAGTHVC